MNTRTEKIEVVSIRQVVDREHFLKSSDYCVKSPEKLADILNEVLDMNNLDREIFVVIPLDTKNYINAIHVASVGSINATIVTPREVFKMLILNNATSFVIAHNHPSGCTQPSPEDIKITNRLKEGGQLMGIELLDHIVIGNQFYSFKANGLL